MSGALSRRSASGPPPIHITRRKSVATWDALPDEAPQSSPRRPAVRTAKKLAAPSPRLQVRQGGVHLPDGDGPVTSDDNLRADLYRTVTMVGVDTIFSPFRPAGTHRRGIEKAFLGET